MSDMKRFNALKKVTAKPMTRGEYNDLRGWNVNVSTSAKDDEGYLIVDPEIEANTLSYHGEVSWVPKENFERHYYKSNDQRVGEMCTAPQDPDHELTEDEIATLASGGSLCDCCEFVSDGDSHPVQPDDHFDFGTAIFLLKRGRKVARAGWNGSGMYAYYVPAASYPVERNNLETMGGQFPGDMVPYREYLALKTAQGDVATWAPSCSDALATDWVLA